MSHVQKSLVDGTANGIYFLSPTSDAFRLLKKRFVTVVLLDSITIKRNEFSLIAFYEVEEEST